MRVCACKSSTVATIPAPEGATGFVRLCISCCKSTGVKPPPPPKNMRAPALRAACSSATGFAFVKNGLLNRSIRNETAMSMFASAMTNASSLFAIGYGSQFAFETI